MRWLELAAPDFDKARRQTKGTALIPIGSIEIHGRTCRWAATR